MNDRLITLNDVTCAYPGADHPALYQANVALHRHDFVGVVGPSGAGKTTLLKALAGRVEPLAGSVERAPGLRLGYVPQVETVDWTFPVTVRQVVIMAMVDSSRRWPWSTPAERRLADAMLDRLGVGGMAGRHISELSGGQQQRVFIARALVNRPDALLLDEPTAGVDVRTRHEVLHLLSDLHADGLCVVLTTHDLNGIAAHLPRLWCINRQVLADGPPLAVLRPDVLEKTFGAPMDVLEHMGLPLVVDRQILSAGVTSSPRPAESVQV